jgi:hypothetical protein
MRLGRRVSPVAALSLDPLTTRDHDMPWRAMVEMRDGPIPVRHAAGIGPSLNGTASPSVARDLAAVDVQDLAGDVRRDSRSKTASTTSLT